MNFSIRYETEYLYKQPVTDSFNALRVQPATTPSQRCEHFDISVEPDAALTARTDYFGTDVIEFGVFKPHKRLAFQANARVSTSAPAPAPDPSWDGLREFAYREAGGEFLLPSPGDPFNGVLDGLVGLARGLTPLSTLVAVTDLIPDRFEYRRGVTGVDSSVSDLLEAGAGVCQDFVTLALIILRRCGIAARYVSGYLFAAPEDGGLESIEIDTHAWLEALLPAPAQSNGDAPAEPIWVGADPTNRGLVGEQHVKIGHGRRYDDVPPTKGVYRGAASTGLRASVRMTRLDSGARTAPASS
jgi:transglutaminase-like putative cysteine protease